MDRCLGIVRITSVLQAPARGTAFHYAGRLVFELKRRWLTLRIVNKLTCFDIKTMCFAMVFSLLDRTAMVNGHALLDCYSKWSESYLFSMVSNLVDRLAMVNGHALLDCYSKWSYTDIMPCPR